MQVVQSAQIAPQARMACPAFAISVPNKAVDLLVVQRVRCCVIRVGVGSSPTRTGQHVSTVMLAFTALMASAFHVVLAHRAAMIGPNASAAIQLAQPRTVLMGHHASSAILANSQVTICQVVKTVPATLLAIKGFVGMRVGCFSAAAT